MLKLIGVGNQKGGVGKTTIITLLANALSQPPFNKSLVVVDLTGQKCISKRRRLDLELGNHNILPEVGTYYGETYAYEPYEIIDCSFFEFESRIEKITSDNEIVLIDFSGYINRKAVEESDAIKILYYLDYLFIPRTQGTFDSWPTEEYEWLVNKVEQQRDGDLKVYRVVNKWKHRRYEFPLIDKAPVVSGPRLHRINHTIKHYKKFELIDSTHSFYDPNSTDPALQDFVSWLDLVTKTIGIEKEPDPLF